MRARAALAHAFTLFAALPAAVVVRALKALDRVGARFAPYRAARGGVWERWEVMRLRRLPADLDDEGTAERWAAIRTRRWFGPYAKSYGERRQGLHAVNAAALSMIRMSLGIRTDGDGEPVSIEVMARPDVRCCGWPDVEDHRVVAPRDEADR